MIQAYAGGAPSPNRNPTPVKIPYPTTGGIAAGRGGPVVTQTQNARQPVAVSGPTGAVGPHSGGSPRQAAQAVAASKGNPTVYGQQRFLQRLGYYHGVLDGIKGPQTLAAIAAFKARHVGGGSGPTGSGSSGATGRVGGGSVGRAPSGGSGGGGSRGGGAGGRGPARAGGGMPAGLINPGKYAASLTKMQYGPVLNQLRAQLAQQRAQNAQNIADLNTRYGVAAQMAANAVNSNDTAATNAVSAQQSNQHSLLNAIGGGASGAATPFSLFGALADANLQGLGQSQHGFDTNQQTLVGQENAQAVKDQQLAGLQAMQNLRTQLTSQEAARGAALAKNQQDAFNQRLQQESAMQAMKLAGMQGNLQMAMGNQALQRGSIQNSMLAKQLSQMAGGSGKATLTSQGKQLLTSVTGRATLGDKVRQLVYPSSGTGNKWMQPAQAWQQMASVIRDTTGTDPVHNAEAFQLVKGLWNEYIRSFKLAHPGAAVNISNNGTPWASAIWRKQGASWA